MTLRTPCRFTFEGMSPIFEGFTNGTRWNGWPNVWVRPDVAAAVAKWSRDEGDDETADEIEAKAPDGDGLISLAYGYTPTLEEEA